MNLSPILFSLLLTITILPAAVVNSIGVNYGTVADNLPPPPQVAQFLKTNTNINLVKIFDTNPDIIKAFANTNVSLTITVPNGDIPSLTNRRNAIQWVKTHVKPYYPATKFHYICVGTEVLHWGPQNFLTVTPIEGLGQHMSALEYRTILKYRLMIPLFPADEPCPVCRKVCLDSFGEHAVHCKELPGFKYRHDLVRDVLYDVLKRAGISSKKEAPVNFLTDPLEGRSTLRPADILVFGWAGAKHACVDLTGVSPLVGLRDNGFVAGEAALKAESSKVAKHEKACLENQHVFIPFAFDTFGFLAPEAEKFLSRVQRVVQSNFSALKKQNFIFSRIGFAIQKGVAAQLVARLPAILL